MKFIKAEGSLKETDKNVKATSVKARKTGVEIRLNAHEKKFAGVTQTVADVADLKSGMKKTLPGTEKQVTAAVHVPSGAKNDLAFDFYKPGVY